LANSFWDHVIQISIRQMNFFRICFPNYEKLKSFVKTFTPCNQIFIFKEQLWVNMDFFMFVTDQAQINRVQLNYSNVSNVFFKVFLQNVQDNL
jgi:hypothetical protein